MRIFCIVLLLLSNSVLANIDAYQIMQKVDEREDGDSMESTQTLILFNSNGGKLTRQIKAFSADQGEDRKSILFLLQPADVRNIGFLSYQWDSSDKSDETWLYLPALDRVERLPDADRSNAFMGSDFSYSDMDGFRLNEWQYRLVEETDKVQGQDCYLIEATPKPEFAHKILKETGYSKVEHWVRKDIDMIVQSKHYVANSAKMKWLTVEEIRQVKNIWTPFKLTMRTYKGERLEHASILILSDIDYNMTLDPNLFTTSRLRQGL